MHVQCLAISSASTDSRSDNDKLVLCDKVPNAALFAGRLVTRVSLDVEFQGRDKGQEEGEEKLEGEEHVDECRQVAVAFWSCKGNAGGMRLE